MISIEVNHTFPILYNLFEQKLVPEIDYIGELGFNFGDITQMTEVLF